MRFFGSSFSFAAIAGLLAALILGSSVARSYAFHAHQIRHESRETGIKTDAKAASKEKACPICDALHVAPFTISPIASLEIKHQLRCTDSLPPIFWSDNAILLPFGARAPPALS